MLCHLQESGKNTIVVVTDEMIDETLKKVRHLYDLTNEDMDPIDAQIGDLTNYDFFEELIDPGSKLLEMVSREVDKNIH